jgi:hypothetical protein
VRPQSAKQAFCSARRPDAGGETDAVDAESDVSPGQSGWAMGWSRVRCVKWGYAKCPERASMANGQQSDHSFDFIKDLG